MSGSSLFPLLLDLRNRRALVVGGGPVGRRKAAKLIEAGAVVAVVDPAVTDVSTHAIRLMEPFREEHLDGIEIAFACAFPEVNRQVVAACRRRGIWVNAASEPFSGDFILPASFRRGGLHIAIGTGGASPALAKRIREKLERLFDAEFAEELEELEALDTPPGQE